MRRHSLLLMALLAPSALLAFGCSRAVKPSPPPNPDIVTFSHKLHVADQGTACADCHPNVSAEKELPAAPDAPKMAKCGDCHDVNKKCEMCHPDKDHPGTYATWNRPTGKLIFKHQPHIARSAGKCAGCHPQTATATRLSQLKKPGHPQCFACHEHQDDYRRASCDRCHTNLRQYPLKDVAVFNHAGNWLDEHKGPAKSHVAACQQCHMARYCDDCHSRHNELIPSMRFPERVDRQLIHRGDWRTRHPIEMAANPGSCLKCHSQKQCLDCHRVEGIAQATPGAGGTNTPGARPHPASWMNPVAPDFHGPAARRNITSCAGCHDRGAGSNCVLCHRVGGSGGNPHPGGKVGGRAGEKNTNKMCRICHS